VISLAHFSLITTRSWAANSWNARVRLKWSSPDIAHTELRVGAVRFKMQGTHVSIRELK
jgi:hypothetical protein